MRKDATRKTAMRAGKLIRALMYNGPLSANAVAEELNASKETARAWIAGFHEAGLVSPQGFDMRKGVTGSKPILWGWSCEEKPMD
jgi:predicted ArsR family transcriptional regulator